MHQNLLYELHNQAGATLLPQGENTPLLTYGAVPDEYAAATDGVIVFDRTDRGLVRVTGADAPDFLHRILANVIKDLEPGQGNRNLLLSGKGKVLFDFDLQRDADGFRLSIGPGSAAQLLQALDMFLFAENVQLTDASEEHAPLHVQGPKAAQALEQLQWPMPTNGHETIEHEWNGSTVRITNLAPFGAQGFTLDAGPELAPKLWALFVENGARPVGRIVADVLRIDACVALPGEDIDENVYPQEARLEEAFNLSKGCYIGQEVVAKIDTYGGLNKRLCTLKISHSDPVPRGTQLMRWSEERQKWRELGFVTSWAYSFQQDTGQVLAYIKRRHQEPGTVFRIGEGPAEATLVL